MIPHADNDYSEIIKQQQQQQHRTTAHTSTNKNLPALAIIAPPRPSEGVTQPWPSLAACRLLAITAHFTYSSTPLTLICVALDILHAGSTSTLLFYPVRRTDGLHRPKREDLVFQVFSSGRRGDHRRILGSKGLLAVFSQTD